MNSKLTEQLRGATEDVTTALKLSESADPADRALLREMLPDLAKTFQNVAYHLRRAATEGEPA